MQAKFRQLKCGSTQASHFVKPLQCIAGSLETGQSRHSPGSLCSLAYLLQLPPGTEVKDCQATSLLGPNRHQRNQAHLPGTMVGLQPSEVPPTTVVKFLGAGTAACFADLLTFPLDTAKVRLQVGAFGQWL